MSKVFAVGTLFAYVAVTLKLAAPTGRQSPSCIKIRFFSEDAPQDVCFDSSTGEVTNVGSLRVVFASGLEGCRTENVSTSVPDKNTFRVERRQSCTSQAEEKSFSAVVTEEWKASPDNLSAICDSTVSSEAEVYWTAPVVFSYRLEGASSLWLPGTGPENALNASYSPLHPIEPSSAANMYWYGDNTVRLPRSYGDFNGANEHDHQRSERQIGHAPGAPSISLPMATMMGKLGAVTFLHDPDPKSSTIAPTAYLQTAASGSDVTLNWTTLYWRLGENAQPVRQRRFLFFSRTPRWRTAMEWVLQSMETDLTPSADVSNYDGNGAYADYHNFVWNSTLSKLEGVTLNWDATFPYPYHGLWLPYNVTNPDDEYHNNNWTTCMPHQNSASPGECWKATFTEWSEQYQRRLSDGVSTCVYGNLFEFGWNMTRTDQPLFCDNVTEPNDQLFCESAHYARGPLAKAVFRQWTFEKGVDESSIIYSGVGKAIVLDAGEPVYRDHLVHMASLISKNVPEAVGVCFDGTGFIAQVNIERDDGITFVNEGRQLEKGKIARSQAYSFHDATAAIAEALHVSGKAMYWNPYYPRMDFGRNVDGYFSEWGEIQPALMANALLAVSKPLITWNPGCYQHPVPSPPLCPPQRKWDFEPSHVLNRLLYWGSMTMPPSVGNDHASIPAPDDQHKLFVHFAPLFALLKGKRWAFDYDVEVVSGTGQANVFHSHRGLTVVVVFGDPGSTIKVRVSHFQTSTGTPHSASVNCQLSAAISEQGEKSVVSDKNGTFPLQLGPYGEGACVIPSVRRRPA